MATNTVKVRKAFRPVERVQVETGPGLTEQSHKKACDMNHILADYRRTGLLKHANKHQGKYDDVTVSDFQEAMFIVTNAQSMFSELPAHMRKKFSNNPAEFLEFVQNPENKNEMQKLGILKGNDGIDVKGAVTAAPTETKAPAEPPAEPAK